MEKRVWIQSGVIEELDEKQSRLVRLVMEKIRFYYRELHGTRPCYRYPLSLSRLMKLCNRSGAAVVSALRILANTMPVGSKDEPPIHYDRVGAERNHTHRPYRVFLRRKSD